MKRIIDGLLYDTDKSEVIYVDKDTKRRLFKTENGRYFIAYPNGEIIPKTEEQTKDYLGEHDIEAYIKEFGEPQEA